MSNTENAIMRWINYKNTSYDGFTKALRYINNPKAAPIKYQSLGYLKAGHEVDDLKIINDRYKKPDDTRLYKHLICAFGDPELSETKAYEFMTQFLESIRKRYPVAFSIHTNIPKRLHAHAIIGMTDIWTGKKFSQSPKDLAEWRTRYDEIAALPEFQMPLLRKSPKECKNKGGVASMTTNDKLEAGNRNEELLPLYQPSPVNVVQPQPCSVNRPTTYEGIAPAMPNDVSLCLAQARRFEAATGFVQAIGRQWWMAYNTGFKDGRNKK